MALGYRVAILSVWWNRGELDTRFFSSKANQKTYFDNIGLTWNSLNNFNINDNITTTIIFRDNSGRTIDTLLKCNYAIVKDKNENYRYYYITYIAQDSANQIKAVLELDDIQTNFIGNVDNISSQVFLYNWTGYNYEVDPDNTGKYRLMTKYYKEDLIGVDDKPLLMNKDSKEGYIVHSNLALVNEWLNANVDAWDYVYLVDNHKIVAPIMGSAWYDKALYTFCSQVITNDTTINYPYKCVSAPVYKANSKRIYIEAKDSDNTTRWFKLDKTSIERFFQLNGYIQGDATLYENSPIGTYGITRKYSIITPLSIDILTLGNYTIDANGDLIIKATQYTANSNAYALGVNNCYSAEPYSSLTPPDSKANAYACVLGGYNLDKNTYNIRFDNPIKLKNITSSDIVYKDSKLLDFNYSKLRLRIANQYYDYNPLGYIASYSDYIYAKYTELLTTGTNKGYLRLENYGAYEVANENDYTGLVASLDLSEPLLTNQWADYLANNKNYYQQTQFNNTIGLISGLGGALTSKTSAQGIKGFNVMLDYTSKLVNQQYNIENMQQAPDSLSNANGNPYFSLAISGIKPRLDYLALPDGVLEQVLSKLFVEGVAFNNYFYFSDILQKHSLYDYIKVSLQKNELSLSYVEFKRLKERLASGVRFWYSDVALIPKTLNYYIN